MNFRAWIFKEAHFDALENLQKETVYVMTIKEMEDKTGLARSNIRFYEKEGLISPTRNEKNGYREYSKTDLENIKKIAWLRTLGVSVEEIRNIMGGKTALSAVLRKQSGALEGQITELQQAKIICDRMLAEKTLCYENLQVEQFIPKLQDYWNKKENRQVLRLDSVSFLYLWGSSLTWSVILIVCLLIGGLFYPKLPPQIPVQWSEGVVTSLVDKKFIFVFPGACILIRCLLQPWIYMKLQMYDHYGEVITEYLTNYLCFVVLSVEVFSILYLYGVVKSIVAVLFVDTAVLIGLLLIGLIRKEMQSNNSGNTRR